MKIQINCDDKVSENSLRYIFHNLQEFIEEYQKNKANMQYIKYVNGKQIYYKETQGNMFIKTKIIITCTGKTMYFKIKESDSK